MKIKFLEDCAGRLQGANEDNPDERLCAQWEKEGVVEILGKHKPKPKPVEDRAMSSPPRGKKKK